MNEQNTLYVVTGAAGGIGKPLCLRLAESGAHLVLVGRNGGPLGHLSTLCLSLGAKSCAIIAGDLRETACQQRIARAVTDFCGDRICLMNNAGINIEGRFEGRDEADIDHIIATNLVAPMQVTQRVLQAVGDKDLDLCIANVGSVLGAIGLPDYVAYSASKAGLRGFTQALNRELGGRRQRAIYFGPRAVATRFNTPESMRKQRDAGQSIDQPATIARWIVRRLDGRRSEYFYGWPERAFIKLNAMLPSLVDRALAVSPTPSSTTTKRAAQEAIR